MPHTSSPTLPMTVGLFARSSQTSAPSPSSPQTRPASIPSLTIRPSTRCATASSAASTSSSTSAASDLIIADLGAQPVIPSNPTRKHPFTDDPAIYKMRNRIERCFNKLKHFRRFRSDHRRPRRPARHPLKPDPQASLHSRSGHLQDAQPHRALLQQAQALPPLRHSIRPPSLPLPKLHSSRQCYPLDKVNVDSA